MGTWDIHFSDLKRYPHFDRVLTVKEAKSIANSPHVVSRHSFYPFIMYKQRWTRFAKKGKTGEEKDRPIRYAARADAYIFSRYRQILSDKYEELLSSNQLHDSVIAYRKIVSSDGKGGKCNIHFAKEAFDFIRSIGDCCVLALDIRKFFETIDHNKLKSIWCRLLNLEKLPQDHFQVFKAITSYSDVEKLAAYERLGHFGEKRKSSFGKPIMGYLTPYRAVPKRLCSGVEFRQKIAGGDGRKTLIKKNLNNYGIPQGSPISDILANISLFTFDIEILKLIKTYGGKYFRYSDDILIIVPGDAELGQKLMEQVCSIIKISGPKLTIKKSKSSIFEFSKKGSKQFCNLVIGKQGRNGLEYLGFRFNGSGFYIRDSTLSNIRRKVAKSSKREASRHAKRYKDKDYMQLQKAFNYNRFIKNFAKVEDFDELSKEYRNWTFWTYAKRAVEVFGSDGHRILRQLKRHAKLIRQRFDFDLKCAVERRANTACP